MNAILFVTGIASAMMFFFFFVLPSLDRARVRESRQAVQHSTRLGRSAKPAH
jgi:hypothetical protein